MPTLISDTGPQDLNRWIAAQATGLGFDAVGFADATAPWRAGDDLKSHLDAGRHGTMDWLATSYVRRAHPTAMWADARSAIVLGVSYGPEHNPMDDLAETERGAISVYAQGDDYHEVIKPRLKQLATAIASRTGAEVKVFVDTAPLMEKPLAARAGVGWQGKHTVLVSRQHGSWLFLGVILTTLDLVPSTPEGDHCGSCSKCLDICPTAAFPAPYQLDSRRCLAYLSNEHAGQIPVEFRKPMSNRIYGCDDCLAVCPWNKFARTSADIRLRARDDLRLPDLAALVTLDDAAFRAMFRKNPVKRLKRDRFVRNVLVAIGNSGAPRFIPAVVDRLRDESPLVRGMAVWALGQLADRETCAAVHGAYPDTDPDVAAEWQHVLGSTS
jgi:epoxyqueuosine reductase